MNAVRKISCRSTRALVLGIICGALLMVFAFNGRSDNLAVLDTLYSFIETNANSSAGLIQDSNGVLWGTTSGGGTYTNGSIFKITTNGVFTTVYSFQGGIGGSNPNSPLCLGSNGNFYGTTRSGGVNSLGTVFEITPGGIFVQLYSFTGGLDGQSPYSGLILARDGYFYGTTATGGANGLGAVFKMTGNGLVSNFYSFQGPPSGYLPLAGLLQASDGAFYGTTYVGGTSGLGTIFQLNPNGGGMNVLYNFVGFKNGFTDGGNPRVALVQGVNGMLFGASNPGVAAQSHLFYSGIIFGIFPGNSFLNLNRPLSSAEGTTPSAPLVVGRDGNLYGVTGSGGTNNQGTVFKFTSSGLFTNVYSFNGTNGGAPAGALLQLMDGDFYATTTTGGANGGGTVFRVNIPGAGIPANDNFNNRFSFGGASNTVTGLNLQATKEAGEPNHAGDPGGASVWWTWYAPSNGYYAMDTSGSSFDTLLAVYTGNSLPGLSLVASDDDANGGVQSRVVFFAQGGTNYQVAVDGKAGAQGTIALHVQPSPPPNDQCSGAIVMTPEVTYSQPTFQATSAGDAADGCNGNTLNAVWYQFTSPTNAYVVLNTCGSDFSTVLDVFTGSCGSFNLIAGGCDQGYYEPPCYNTEAQLSFYASPNVTYWIMAGGSGGGKGNLSLVAHASPLLSINCPDPISVFTAGDAPAADPNSVQILSPGCGGLVKRLYSESDSETQIIRTYEVEDSCGQIEFCYQSINLTCRPPRILRVDYQSQSVQPDGIHILFYGSTSGDVNSYNWQVIAGDYLTSNNFGNGYFDVVVSPTNTEIIQVELVGAFGPCGGDNNGQSGTGAGTCAFCLSHGTPSLLSGTTGSGANLTAKDTCLPLSANTRWYRMIAYDAGLITVSAEGSSNVNQIAVCSGPSIALLTNINCVVKPQTRVTFSALANTAYWFAVDPGTNSPSTLRVASGYEPSIQSAGVTNGVFELLSTIAPPTTYKVIASTNPALPLSNWPVVFTTNWNSSYSVTNFHIDFRDTNLMNPRQRFYRLAPGP